MKLALRELRRRPGRFVTATIILTLVAVLVMFLGGLLDGLISGATGALRAQQADVIVYSDTARTTFVRSRIDADTRAAVEAVPGVARTGGIGIVQLGARVPGNGPRDLAATALFGYELAPSGIPEPPAPGEVYADDVLRADGVEVGMEILLGPARSPVTVIGFVTDVSYSGQGSLWAEPGTWREVMAANRPDVRLPDDSFQALVVEAADGVDADRLAAEIDDAVGGGVESLSITGAIDAIPGVRQQRSTFNQIIGVTIAIAAVVVALFFALLTVERLALYGVLKALGARSRTLFAGLVAQAVVVTTAASIVAGTAAFGIDALIPAGSIPLDISARRVILSAAPPPRRRHRRLRLLPPPGAPRRPGRRDWNRLMSKQPDTPDSKSITRPGTEPATDNGEAPGSDDGEAALELRAVRKVYPMADEEVVALDHADLRVAPGEIVALVGPSGSGKTTLCSIAGGLLTPTEGTIVVGGEDISNYSARQLTEFRQNKVGFVFQSVNLVPFLTARENLLVVDELGRRTGAAARQRADQLLDELGLGDRSKNLPAQLSGGQRQRVAIGRALMNDPELVLFDEPTSALDTKLGEQVMELIRREMKDRGTAAVVVTHDDRMTHHCDRVVHIVDGVIAA